MKSRNFKQNSREIVVILHNIRSVFNVGAILRTAECFGVSRVFASGFTPNFEFYFNDKIAENLEKFDKKIDKKIDKKFKKNDKSFDEIYAKILPHQKEKLLREIHKTALGAEEKINFKFAKNVFDLLENLRAENFSIVGLEQDARAISLPDFNEKFAQFLDEKRAEKSEKFAENSREKIANSAKILHENYKNFAQVSREKSEKIENISREKSGEKFGKITLILGEEVAGISENLRASCDFLTEIPMFGAKESFNVSVACGIALYEFRE